VAVPARRPGRWRPRRVRGVRSVPAALPHLPRHRGGVGVTAWADRGDAFGGRGAVGARWDVRALHGSLPRVPSLRGRLSVARTVRSDGRTRARPGRAA